MKDRQPFSLLDGEEYSMAEKKKDQVDINHASAEQIATLKGIGPNLAQKIIANRPYQKLDELVRVSGINQVKLAALLPYIAIGKTKAEKPAATEPTLKETIENNQPVSTLGKTEAFVFLEDRNERQDAFLIILGGFIFGLLIILLRRARK
jgi:competence protein ComEA